MINNNIISAYEKSGAEVIVMGRGIGFKKKQGEIKVDIGLVASAALCAFICGVTEPFEFGFMFLTPGLYVIYALYYMVSLQLSQYYWDSVQASHSQQVQQTFCSPHLCLQHRKHG